MDQNPITMSMVLEGILFAAGEEGVSVKAFKNVFPDLSLAQIDQALHDLQKKYASGFGFELACFGDSWKFVTCERIFPYAKRLYEQIKPPSFSNAALETLAIIAYKQPVTRVEIEEIRGVACDAILKKLQARELIEANSRSDAVGKPLLYTVTDSFMDTFGLTSLQELPDLETGRPGKNLFEENSDTKQARPAPMQD